MINIKHRAQKCGHKKMQLSSMRVINVYKSHDIGNFEAKMSINIQQTKYMHSF